MIPKRCGSTSNSHSRSTRPVPGEKPSVILDTDIGSDCDDAGALAESRSSWDQVAVLFTARPELFEVFDFGKVGLHRNTQGQTLCGEEAGKKIKDVPEKATATMDLMDFQPRSTLIVPEHKVIRSKFPSIDAHTHMCNVFGRRRGDKPATPLPGAEEYIAEAVKTMDPLNLKTIVNLTGGNGEELTNKIARLDRKYPGRFMTCTQPDYLKINDPGYPQWQADELRRNRTSSRPR